MHVGGFGGARPFGAAAGGFGATQAAATAFGATRPAAPAFGAGLGAAKPFGAAAAPTGGFGGGQFGAAAASGTSGTKYAQTTDAASGLKMVSITAMAAYNKKSAEVCLLALRCVLAHLYSTGAPSGRLRKSQGKCPHVITGRQGNRIYVHYYGMEISDVDITLINAQSSLS